MKTLRDEGEMGEDHARANRKIRLELTARSTEGFVNALEDGHDDLVGDERGHFELSDEGKEGIGSEGR